ncbi:Flp pilus assembly protein CpaB [Vibrio navarrensis]
MKQRLTQILALLALGVGVYGIVSEMLFANPQSVETIQVLPEEQKVRVWRLATEVLSGESFRAEQVLADGLNESDAGQLLSELPYGQGAVFRHPLKTGHLLQRDDLIFPSEPDYIDTIMQPGMTSFPLSIDARNFVAGGIKAGDYIDILSLTSLEQNLAQQDNYGALQALSIDVKPLLSQVRVLAIQGRTYDDQAVAQYETAMGSEQVTLVLEIPHAFISKMTLAKRLSALEVYKSRHQQALPHAQTKDILPGYQGIVELRGARRG